MLQDIYKAIADMNLQYGDGEVVKPTNEAELVRAIEFLDSTEKKNLKDIKLTRVSWKTPKQYSCMIYQHIMEKKYQRGLSIIINQ